MHSAPATCRCHRTELRAQTVEDDLDVLAPRLLALRVRGRLDRAADERGHVACVEPAPNGALALRAPDQLADGLVQLLLRFRDVRDVAAALHAFEQRAVAPARVRRRPDEPFQCRTRVRLLEQLARTRDHLLEART